MLRNGYARTVKGGVIMQIKVKRVFDAKINVSGVTLLSVQQVLFMQQVMFVPKDITKCNYDKCDYNYWWLRSPGYGSSYAADVNIFGYVNTVGNYVYDTYSVVRPALEISNPESSELAIGDRFNLFGYDWTVIFRDMALCDTGIGRHRFDPERNNWEASELKTWLEDWLKEKMAEAEGRLPERL